MSAPCLHGMPTPASCIDCMDAGNLERLAEDRRGGGAVVSRPVLYIAGPYTYPDPARNVHRAVQVGTYLMDHGLAWPLIPHLSMLWDTISPRPYADWLALDFVLLERCDGLVRLAGTSTGADGETDWCTKHGVPWLALSDGWAADSSLGSLWAWIEETWPTEEAS